MCALVGSRGVLSVVFRVCFLVGCGIRLAFGVVRPGRASGVGVCAGERGFRAGPQASCVWVVFWGVWVYIRNPRERGARPGVLVTVNAAACYSPTSSRVQYHRRARP